MESELYGGPETVEHVWERDDDFQSYHVRRRDGTDSAPESPGQKQPAGYLMIFDEKSGEMTFREVSAEQ